MKIWDKENTILIGCGLYRNTLIAAELVITNSVENINILIGGVPAKKIKEIHHVQK